MCFMVTWENFTGSFAFVGITLALRRAVKALHSDMAGRDDAQTLACLAQLTMAKWSRFIEGRWDF